MTQYTLVLLYVITVNNKNTHILILVKIQIPEIVTCCYNENTFDFNQSSFLEPISIIFIYKFIIGAFQKKNTILDSLQFHYSDLSGHFVYYCLCNMIACHFTKCIYLSNEGKLDMLNVTDWRNTNYECT